MAKRATSYLRLVAPHRDPDESCPGVVDVNRTGLALAIEMLERLEDGGGTSREDEHEISLADYACLENWPREGRPFRNVVAEYLAAARKEGPEVEAGFCAVLTDMAALLCTGAAPNAARYQAAPFTSAATT